MLIFLNGQFVPEERAVVSVFDRGFLYGDGLFETLRVFNGTPFRWAEHMERLQSGAAYLKLALPCPVDKLRRAADELIVRNKMPDALMRITVSRGVGIRGYSPKGANSPTLVISLHPAPSTDAVPQWKLVTASFHLPAGEALAQFKTCNKLPQILARGEADAAGADEALLLNTDGFIVEGASSNLFWIEGETVCTPPLASGILAGVTRATILEICGSLALPTREANIAPRELQSADGVLISNSAFGAISADSLNGKPLKQSPIAERIRRAYQELLCAETARVM